MANGFHADILYAYLVDGLSQQKIAEQCGTTQAEVSRIIRKDYGLNFGNVKWGKGSTNQRGKYSFLSYDDICAFIDSGSRDLDAWLNGNGGYDSGPYNDSWQDDSGNGSYNTYTQPQYGNGSYNTHTQPQYGNGYSRHPGNRSYGGGGNRRPTKEAMDGRMVLLLLGILILVFGWLVNKFGSTTGAFGQSLQILWHSEYLWIGLITGGIFGFIKYTSCRSLGEVFTTCGTWAWAGLGYVVGAVIFFYNYGLLLPSVILAALGVIIGFVGYKLFYRL